jgi:methylase of polypeptide subunit release factors
MDYDETKTASAYDAGRSYEPDVLKFWLGAISSAIGKDHFEHILDLGCGAGRYSAALAAHFEADVIEVSTKGVLDAKTNTYVDFRHA